MSPTIHNILSAQAASAEKAINNMANTGRTKMPIIKSDDNLDKQALIKVVGVGGAGGNAVNRMVKLGMQGVEFISVNTDGKALGCSLADVKIPIGQKITKGLGAGAKPDVGYAAIQEDRAAVTECLQGADMVFIAAGMGGGTGTGAAPVVAEIAREMGILSVAVVTRPFLFEGPIRGRNCASGIAALRQYVDTIIIINNQKIRTIAGKGSTADEAFRLADDVLVNAVRGITDIIMRHGNIHVDFADVRTIMESGGDALMGTGIGTGEDRAIKAAEQAINTPLIDDIGVSGASGVLVNISHGKDFTMDELDSVMTHIFDAVGEDNSPNIIFGDITLEELGDQVMVTVIATGFQKDGRASYNGYAPLSNVIQQPAASVAPSAPAPQNMAAQPQAQPVPQAPAAAQQPQQPQQPDTGSQRRVEMSIPRTNDSGAWNAMAAAPIMRTGDTATMAADRGEDSGAYAAMPRLQQPEPQLDESSWSNPYTDVRQERAYEEEILPPKAETVYKEAQSQNYEPTHFGRTMQNDRFTRDNRAMTSSHNSMMSQNGMMSQNNGLDDGDAGFDHETYNIPAYLRNSGESGTPAIFRNGDPRF